MNNIPHLAEECNVIPTANNANQAASDASVPVGNVPVRNGEEEKDKTLMLSRELALDINPEQADLTASLIICGLYTWQVSKRRPFGYNPTIDGKPAAYRSLRDLEDEYPWLAHNSILKALRRAEERLHGEFIMQLMKRRGQYQLHFLLSDKLIKKYKLDLSFKSFHLVGKEERLVSKWKREKSGLISFLKSEAIRYGMLGALLVNNLRWVVDAERNVASIEDEVGNLYRQLSPTGLTKPVQNKDGLMKAPLPVSPDTVTRELKKLKADGAIYEHPVENNFFTLVSTMKPLNSIAAKVTTLAAEVNTSAAKVTSKSEVMRCNAVHMNDIQQLFESLDSNGDGNRDGKYVTTHSSSLREAECVEPLDEAFQARKGYLLSVCAEALRVTRQREELGVPNYDIRHHAVYRVEDDDKVRLAGYELDHEVVMADWETGKPYTREREVNNYLAECRQLFRQRRMPYKPADEQRLRVLFTTHPHFTPDMVTELTGYDYFDGLPKVPSKGHDFHFFIRRTKTAGHFLRYLPQLIRERFLNDQLYKEWYHHPVTKEPMFDYWEMEQPFLDMAFADGKVPVTWDYFKVQEQKPQLGTVLRDGQNQEFLTGKMVEVITTRAKPIYYKEWTSGEYDPAATEHIYLPVYSCYRELLTLPVVDEEWPEPVEYDSVAMKKWEAQNGPAKFIERNDYWDCYKARALPVEEAT